ncbi:MAG: AAA family ATPase [Candidatus Methanoperedens sp.]
MITDLIVKNFKSIGENGVKVELKPLTILLGPNGSGKSSILEAIGILSQSAEKMDFQTNGNLVRIPRASNIFYKGSSENWLTFEIHIKATDAEMNKLITISKNELSNDIQEVLYKRDIEYKLSYKWKTNEFNQSVMIGNHEIAKAELIKVGESGLATKLEFPNKTSSSPWVGANQILNEQVFRDHPKEIEESTVFSDIAMEIVRIMKARLLNQVFLISAIRGQTEFEEKIVGDIDTKLLKVLGVGGFGTKTLDRQSFTQNNLIFRQ